ncbi:MAG: SCO1664 family protein [Dermatophilus congolensis]|nr:SCO1664 family protein [Dermatophilus congolensis]
MTSADSILADLAAGDLEIVGRLAEASNVAFLVRVSGRHAIYKPVMGERPLWDFPDGNLASREVAAHVVSTAGGWGLVPPTVLRSGPFGLGSVQDWIGPVPDENGHLDTEARETGLIGIVPVGAVPEGWHTVMQGELGDGSSVFVAHADDARLRSLAVLDAVLNNSDRKGSHVLRGGVATGPATGEDAIQPTDPADAAPIWGIDNGLCLGADDKLRTVLWGWADEPLPPAEIDRCEALAAALEGEAREVLEELVTLPEMDALDRRLERLLRTATHPRPSHDWPALPWPPL